MKSFMRGNFCIKDITFAALVEPQTKPVHYRNRAVWGLAFIIDEELIYHFQNGTALAPERNEIIFLPKGSTYRADVIDPGKIGCYAINFTLVDCDANDFRVPFVAKVKNPKQTLERFRDAARAFLVKKEDCIMTCKAALCGIISDIQKEYHSSYLPSAKKNLIAAEIEFIHENYTSDKINVNELAKSAGISEAYFRRIFTDIYGKSPVQYINELRIIRAKELLSSGFYSVSEVASMSGFFDDSYFSRTFKKHTGVSPNRYAENK